MIGDASRPKLARKARLQWDAIESRWMILAPERGIALSTSAAEIVKRCDGEASIAAIAKGLAREHGAAEAVVLRDVTKLVTDLHARSLIDLTEVAERA